MAMNRQYRPSLKKPEILAWAVNRLGFLFEKGHVPLELQYIRSVPGI